MTRVDLKRVDGWSVGRGSDWVQRRKTTRKGRTTTADTGGCGDAGTSMSVWAIGVGWTGGMVTIMLLYEIIQQSRMAFLCYTLSPSESLLHLLIPPFQTFN